jgi:hypothetical protein
MAYNPMTIHNEYKQLQEMRKRYDAGEITANEYYGYVDDHSILKGRRVNG